MRAGPQHEDDAGRDKIFVWRLNTETGKLTDVSVTTVLAGSDRPCPGGASTALAELVGPPGFTTSLASPMLPSALIGMTAKLPPA